MNKLRTNTLLIIAGLLLTGTFALADDAPQTLFGDVFSFSGYGGVTLEYARLGNDSYGWLTGGRGAVIINDTYAIGGAGKMLVYPTDREDLTGMAYTGEEPYAHVGYGGLLFEYYLNPKDLFHVSLGVLAGAGGVTYSQFSIEDDGYDGDDHPSKFDAFFVVEPEVNIFLNLTRFCRAGVGVSYRYPYGISGNNSAAELTDETMRGFNGICQIQFGWF